MAIRSGLFIAPDGLPKNDVPCKLWSAASFASAPVKGTALPSGNPLQSTTTGTTHGGDGQYRFTGVTSGDYYVSFEHAGTRVYDSFTVPVASDFPTVMQYGAVGDGVADDLSAINAALADTAEGVIVFPPGTYLCSGSPAINNRTGLLILGYGATIRFSGSGTATSPRALELTGTCRDIAIKGLRFLGDGTAANYHGGVKVLTNANVEGLTISECHFESVTSGFWGLRTASGVWVNFLIDRCEFETTIGTGAGQGRGVSLNNNYTEPLDFTVRDCNFDTTRLYAVEVVNGIGIVVKGNTFRYHRSDTSSGALAPAVYMPLAAGQNVRIEGNLFESCSDGAIAVVPSGSSVRHVQILSNVCDDAQTDVADITVGSTSPAANGTVELLTLSGNQHLRSACTTPAILVNSALEASIQDNQIENLGLTAANTPCIRLAGSGDAGATSTYNGDFTVSGNVGVVTLSGGTGIGIELAAAFCTSAIHARFSDNHWYGVATGFRSVSSITNDNLSIDPYAKGTNTSSGLTFDTASHLMEKEIGPLLLLTWLRMPWTAKTADATLTVKETCVRATGGLSGITLTLPVIGSSAGQAHDGHLLFVAKIDSDVGQVGLAPQGTDTIVGISSSSSLSLPRQFSAVLLMADDTSDAWRVIGEYGIHEIHNWKSIATADSPYALTDRDEVIKADTSGGNIEIDLLGVTGRDGRRIRIERPSAANTLTIDPDGTEQIDGGGAGTPVTLAAAAGNWWDYQVAGGEWKRVGGRF